MRCWTFCVLVVVAAACGGSMMSTPPDLSAASDDLRDAGANSDAMAIDAAGPRDLSAACDVPAPTFCPSPAPTYAEIAPIIVDHCYECHDGTGPSWALTSYAHVSDWQDTMRDELRTCGMPPAVATHPLSLDDRLKILVWLRCGLPE